MALSAEKRNKIIADYLELRSYNAVGKLNGCATNTVRKIVQETKDIDRLCEEKKEEAIQNVLEYMDARRDVICEIIGKCLDVLNDEDKLAAATPNQITTALGTLIDKWTGMQEMLKKGEQQGVVMMPEVKE